MNYEKVFENYLRSVEMTLEDVLPPAEPSPGVIHEAMRYSVFPGGKRFRPILTLAACEACGGEFQDALIPAAAVELVHCYSLVHDDLPALDNDSERRGKPTCHKKFGESMAILAGDGLLTLAFQILGRVQPAQRAVQMLLELSTSAGTYGMIGGQVADLSTPKKDLTLPMLDFISTHKTGKLIKASVVCGAIAAGADEKALASMTHYGESVGLAFQAIDDLLDEDGYVRHIKAKEIRIKVRELIAVAKREAKSLEDGASALLKLADFLLERLPQGSQVATHS